MNQIVKYENVDQLYDVIYRERTADVNFYRELVKSRAEELSPPHVLEVGAGTGRVLLPIAQENPSLLFTAVDMNQREMDVLRNRIVGLPVRNISTVISDINCFHTPERFLQEAADKNYPHAVERLNYMKSERFMNP